MKKKRILACLIDFIIIIFLVNIIGYIIEKDILFSNNFWTIMMILFISMIFKDLIFRNQSIGKKILNISIKNLDNTIPSILIIIFRNITLVLWPLEGIILLITNKRIADMIFKTKVL